MPQPSLTPADIERVFGRERLRMLTGDHVEVYREESQPGERRSYTKRFLATEAGDFRHWTEREWRILARLVGHGVKPVPDVVRFDRGARGRTALVQTYDAGVTVDFWGTLLPVARDGRVLRHVFQDCAHWWALARHCLLALDAIHELQLVHLDLKADNVCIPLGPADFDPHVPGQVLHARFEEISLIDFAFSLVSGEPLERALPIARQPDHDYQSPRLLHALEAGCAGDLMPTRQLDWRCDLYSLAAMLRRYLPDPDAALADGWTAQHRARARTLVRRLLAAHDAARTTQRPHAALIAFAAQAFEDDPALAASLQRGWTLATLQGDTRDAARTPVTRVVGPLPVPRTMPVWQRPTPRARLRRTLPLLVAFVASALGVPLAGETWLALRRPEAPPAPRAEPLAAAASTGDPLAAAPEPAPTAGLARAAPVPAVAPVAAPEPAPEPAAVAAPAQERPAARPLAMRQAAARPPAPREVFLPAAPKPAAAVASRNAAGAPVAAGVETKRLAAALPPPKTARPSRAATAPAPRAPAPPALVPVVAAIAPPPPLPAPPVEPAPVDFAARAGDLMAGELPRWAQRAERAVLRVLFLAAQAGDEEIRDALGGLRRAGDGIHVAGDGLQMAGARASTEARRLDAAAQAAFWHRGDVAEAVRLQTRAFGANPLDAEAAGNLAFLLLKQPPVQAETARQLALHALTTRDARDPRDLRGRAEDWTTLAVASALAGRERDARNALFVALALAPDLGRHCRIVLSAHARHGEALRAPVEAMLMRVHRAGASGTAPHCEWPPHWAQGGR